MNTQELEQAIREKFIEIYNSIYLGKLWVTKLDPIGYQIKIGLNTPEAPRVIYAELEDDKFLEFLQKEIKDMKLNTVFYGKLFKTAEPECIVVNKSCSCNDKR